MKAILSTTALQHALGIVGKVVPPRYIKPVLQCVKLDALANINKIIISGTDLECRAVVNMTACEVDEPGACLIDAGRLASIMRLANDESVIIESSDDFSATVKLDGRQYRLLGYDPADYPAAPVDDAAGSITLTAEQVKRIAAIVPIAAKSASHYAMSAILMDGKTVVATDGHRLAALTLNIPANDEWGSVLIPPRMFNLIALAIGDTVTLTKTATNILADTDGATFFAPQIQGNFPKYQDVIPPKNTRWTVNRSHFIDAVNAAAVMTSEESRGVKVVIADNVATLTARQAERGDAEVAMPIDGEDFTTAFNPAFVVDGLNAITTEDIAWTQSGPLKPALFAGGDCQMVVMPIEVGQ